MNVKKCDRCSSIYSKDEEIRVGVIMYEKNSLHVDLCPACQKELLDFIECCEESKDIEISDEAKAAISEAAGPFMKTYANALRSVATEITSTCDIIESMLTEIDDESEEDDK